MITPILFWIITFSVDMSMRKIWGRYELASTINATIISATAIACLELYFWNLSIDNTIYVMKIWIVWYFVFDIFISSKEFILHHVAALLLIFSDYGDLRFFSICILLTEIPVPFINYGLYALHTKTALSTQFTNIGITLFAVTRLLILPLAVIANIRELYFNKLLLISVLVLIYLNFYWAVKIHKKTRN
jgi:hypothetical protein